MMMGGLWKQVGLKGAPVRLVGHAIAQVHYDGAWHVMDGDLGMIYLLRDNETLDLVNRRGAALAPRSQRW